MAGTSDHNSTANSREAVLDIKGDEFRKLGYQLVDQISNLLEELPGKKVTQGEDAQTIRSVLGRGSMPEIGTSAEKIFNETTEKLFNHSLFNGHPKFWGYITSSAAPIGILGDMLAASVNPNVGGSTLSPMATEIETQTIKWIAELISYPVDCGGILVSGGNMANFVAFAAARTAKANWDIRKKGVNGGSQLIVYGSKSTHTWIEKATDLFGMGTDAIRWIATDDNDKMRIDALETQIRTDVENGFLPFMVIGAAGTVGMGSVDPLIEIEKICKKYDLWFHVDGAYGAPAAMLPEASEQLKALSLADSVALDPHKWLYAPLEAGCALVRDRKILRDSFSYVPDYYSFGSQTEDPPLNYFEYGFQNSRGFRALKVWLALRHAGKQGYIKMIRDDISLSKQLFDAIQSEPELEAVSNNLSITTFRFVPKGCENDADYLNELNKKLLDVIQTSGDAFVSNAVFQDKYLLRCCIVNFRTQWNDLADLIDIVKREGAKLHKNRTTN